MRLEDTKDDMCEINNLTPQTIFHNMKSRFQSQQIFTFIGSTLLVVNPYYLIKTLFNQQIIQNYIHDESKGLLNKNPHIYTIAANAFRGIKKEGKQSIIVSGQSGAGKTQSTKYCMQILTRLSKDGANQISSKILACNPILQAFGNSKTVRNQNSSRFGKFVQIFFNKNQQIKGAKIKSYLLQKGRITTVQKNQRNFHIFYTLTSRNLSKSRSASQYRYLSQSGCYSAENINDYQLYDKINRSFDSLGFEQRYKDRIWLLLRFILEIGNLEFDDKKFNEDQNNNTCEITNSQFVDSIIKELNIITKQQFYEILLKKKRGEYSNSAQKVICISNRDALSRAIYSTIFDFIINKISLALMPKQNNVDIIQPQQLKQIGLLDIFGFQNFDKNSLEQLCINFANQNLLTQYNNKIFENEMKILQQDGLKQKLKDIKPPSNQYLINNIIQVIKIINDKTTNNFYKEEQIIPELKTREDRQIRQKRQRKIQTIKTSKQLFIIQHSPSKITYSTIGFKIKNEDQITNEITQLCNKLFDNNSSNNSNNNNGSSNSSNSSNNNKNNNNKIQNKKKSILIKFTQQINSLISKLDNSNNHFVRCIKSNNIKRQNYIDQNYMNTQIKYLGVYQSIKIRKAIFPYRKKYQQFILTYQSIFKFLKRDTDFKERMMNKSFIKKTIIILQQVQARDNEYLQGQNRIYISQGIVQRLQRQYARYIGIRNNNIKIIEKSIKIYSKQNRQLIEYQKLKLSRFIFIWSKYLQKIRLNKFNLAFQHIIFYVQELLKQEETIRQQERIKQQERRKRQQLEKSIRQQQGREIGQQGREIGQQGRKIDSQGRKIQDRKGQQGRKIQGRKRQQQKRQRLIRMQTRQQINLNRSYHQPLLPTKKQGSIIQQLQQQITQLNLKMDEKYQQYNNKIQQYNRQIKQKQIQFTNTLSQLQKQNNRLKQRQFILKKQNNELRQQLQYNNKQIKQLQSSQKLLSQYLKNINKLQKQLSFLREQNIQLKQQIQNNNNRISQQLEQQNNNLRLSEQQKIKQLQTNKQKLNNILQTNIYYQNMVIELQKIVEKNKKQINLYIEKITKYLHQLSQKNQMIQHLRSKNIQLQSNTSYKDKQIIKRLKQKINKLQQQLSQSQQMHQRASLNLLQAQQLNYHLYQSNQLDQSAYHPSRLKIVQQQLQQSKQKINKLQKIIKDNGLQIKQLKKQKQNYIIDFNNKINQFNRKIDRSKIKSDQLAYKCNSLIQQLQIKKKKIQELQNLQKRTSYSYQTNQQQETNDLLGMIEFHLISMTQTQKNNLFQQIALKFKS